MLVGSSQAMAALRQRVARVARTDFTVLIEGESGAGKELVAREIHEHSPRRFGPFVPVNCAAIVETLVETELFGIEERIATGVKGRRGKFELAEDGTLFLDEVGDLSLTAQAKLLRVLQDLCIERVGGTGVQRVNTRIVAATNRPLAQMARELQFRPDLYYRLSGVEIVVPPLRDRRDDVPALLQFVLGRYVQLGDWQFTEAAIEALLAYEWPGNVRQLERVVERAVALATPPLITLEDLPIEISGAYSALTADLADHGDYSLKTWSRRFARLVLERSHGNRRVACERLGISYHTLRTYLGERDEAAKRLDAGPRLALASAKEPVGTLRNTLTLSGAG